MTRGWPVANKNPRAKCRGTSNRTGKPCKNFPITGGLVCSSHGGSAPQVKARAAIRAELFNWGLGDVTVNPDELMLRLISQSATRVERLSTALNELADEHGLYDALVGDTLVLDDAGKPHKIGEYHRVLSSVEGTERDRCMNFCRLAGAAGIDKRIVELAESRIKLMADTLRAILGDPDVGLTPEQRTAATGAMRRHLAIAAE